MDEAPRAADPTLTAWALEDQHRVLVTMPGGIGGKDAMGEVLTAHRRDLPCGSTEPLEEQRSRFARWTAVPCSTCFPHAPPPGHIAPTEGQAPSADPGLAWQLGDPLQPRAAREHRP